MKSRNFTASCAGVNSDVFQATFASEDWVLCRKLIHDSDQAFNVTIQRNEYMKVLNFTQSGGTTPVFDPNSGTNAGSAPKHLHCRARGRLRCSRTRSRSDAQLFSRVELGRPARTFPLIPARAPARRNLM